MADLGSVQLLALGFDLHERLPASVARQVRRLRARGIVGVLDVLVVSKTAHGDVRYESGSKSDADEPAAGSILARLFEDDELDTDATELLDMQNYGDIGLDLDTIERFASRLQPGTMCLLMLVEARWAMPLLEAALAADGLPIMFGCLESETMLVFGPSLARAVATRAHAEGAAAAMSAGVLDALASADDDASKGVGATLRTLLSAGFIVDADIVEAVRALADDDLLPRSPLPPATRLRVAGRPRRAES